ncbi:hypothetical protein BH24ACT5_BH24ACT5_20130 [soil metagenome]
MRDSWVGKGMGLSPTGSTSFDAFASASACWCRALDGLAVVATARGGVMLLLPLGRRPGSVPLFPTSWR